MPISSASKQERRKTATSGNAMRRDSHAGFSMLEVVLALVILGLLASLGLPFIRPHTGATALRAKAFDIVSLLRADRNAAIQSGKVSTIAVDAQHGRIHSGRTGGEIVLSPPMSLKLLPQTATGLAFYPDGRAVEGEIALLSGRDMVRITVSGPTSMVSIMEPSLAPR
jgi:prepilin-type N-terminal cleavage/methylation domain-containing protein